MRMFDAIGEKPQKKREYLLPKTALVRLAYPGGTCCSVVAEDEHGKKTTIADVKTDQPMVEKVLLKNFTKLSVSHNQASSTAVQVDVKSRQNGEPMDNRPVEKPEQSPNILQQIRKTVQQQMGVQREAFLENRTGLIGYELPEDAPDEFEEDIMGKVDQAQKEAEEKLKQKAETDERSQDSPATVPADTADDKSNVVE